MSAITLMADIVILNMLLVVSCLPIVTVGAAVRAASAVARDMAAGIGSRYHMQFFRELTSRWKPVSLFWGLLFLLGALLTYQQFVVFQAGIDGAALTVIQALALSGAFIIAGISVWFFGLASTRGEDRGFADYFTAATLMAFRFLGRTVLTVAILVAAAAVIVALPIAWAVPLTFFFAPAFAIYLIRLVIAGPLGEQLGVD